MKIQTDHFLLNAIFHPKSKKTLASRVQELKEFSDSKASLPQDGLDFDTVEQLHADKKEASKLLKDPTVPDELKKDLEKVILQYRLLVCSCKILQEIRELGRVLKSPTPPKHLWGHYNPTLLKFEHFFDTNTIEELCHDVQSSQRLWKPIKRRLWDAARETQAFLKSGKKITWVSGSRSAALPMIAYSAKTSLGPEPALVPTGYLLKHNVVPITGELGFGACTWGVNRVALSGLRLVKIDTALGYANQRGFIFDPRTEINIIEEFDPKQTHFIPRLRIAVLRLLLMDPHNEKIPLLKEHIKINIIPNLGPPIIEEGQTKSSHERIQEILTLFDNVQPLDLSDKDYELIERSFPIVWASCTLDPKPFFGGTPGEAIIERKAILGEDIQLVFTENRCKNRLREAVGKWDVKVMSFDAARYIMAEQLHFDEYGVQEMADAHKKPRCEAASPSA